MYDALTFRELTLLQGMLYEGTEKAFSVASSGCLDSNWFGRYRPIHSEVGHLFIEAGTELLERFDHEQERQAA